MAIAQIQSSFAAGELSPALYGRTDLDKFQVGAALLRNFVVDYRGGAINRAGLEFISDVSDMGVSLKLIPFIVSSEASYVLVFGDANVRIFTSGVYVDDVSVPYAAADVALLKYSQSADVLTLTHPSYPPANLSRTGPSTFVYTVIVTGPTIGPPIITTFVAPHGGPYNYSYLVTALNLDGTEESMHSNIGVKNSEAFNEFTNRVMGLSWSAPSESVLRYNVYKWGPIDAVTLNPATVWGFIGSAQAPTFTDNNIAADFSKQPPLWGDPFSGGQIQTLTLTSPGAGYDGISGGWPVIPYVPLVFTGDGTGAAGWAVIDHANGTIVGAYLTNAGKNYTTVVVTADGEGGTGATFDAILSDITPLYPACVSYIQQRRAFAGATLQPDTFVLSQPGLFNNFNTTPVALDTDAIGATISSLQVNAVKALVPVSYGLLAFTSGGCYLLSGDGPSQPISPSTISVTQQASPGANDLIPLQVNYDILFGAAKGNRILSAGFAWERQSYIVTDVSELAPHLFDSYATNDWCWAESPQKIVWAVRDDGKFLSLTYVPEEKVYAWARHDTQGVVLGVCAVPESGHDAVYFIVSRYVPDNGTVGAGGWFTYLERMFQRGECCLADARFLDSALESAKTFPAFDLYPSAATGNITFSLVSA